MANQMTPNGLFGRKTSLFAAGLLAATASLALLPTTGDKPANAMPKNPVMAKVLADARKHRNKGRYKQAAAILKEHATASNPFVLLDFAKLQARGWGVPKDLDEARDKLLMAVQHDFAKRGEAAFELGRVYRQSQGKDCKRIAFEWFVESAKAGHVKAHAELGRHYARGIGVPVDMHAALKHYRIAARSGAANSLVSFVQRLSKANDPAFAHVDLKGLIKEAIPALESEASGGRGSSAKVLGRLYRDGVHVNVDLAVAQMWFERGARLGDSGSMLELAQMLQRATTEPTEIKRSLTLLETAADLRNAGALTALGRLHVANRFGLKPGKAAALFKRGAKAGHAGSMLELARLHLSGNGAKKDLQQALKLLQRGAGKGHVGCQKLLEKLIKLNGKTDEASISKLLKRSPVQPLLLREKPAVTVLHLDELKRRIKKAKAAKNDPNSRSRFPMTGATTNAPFGRKS